MKKESAFLFFGVTMHLALPLAPEQNSRSTFADENELSGSEVAPSISKTFLRFSFEAPEPISTPLSETIISKLPSETLGAKPSILRSPCTGNASISSSVSRANESHAFVASLTMSWGSDLLCTQLRNASYEVVSIISLESRLSDNPAIMALTFLSVAESSSVGNGSSDAHTTLSSHAQSLPSPLPSSSFTYNHESV